MVSNCYMNEEIGMKRNSRNINYVQVMAQEQVFLYYFVNESYGEPLTAYSPLQGFGFLVLICGQLTYEGVIRIPGLKYDDAYINPGAEGKNLSSTKLILDFSFKYTNIKVFNFNVVDF